MSYKRRLGGKFEQPHVQAPERKRCVIQTLSHPEQWIFSRKNEGKGKLRWVGMCSPCKRSFPGQIPASLEMSIFLSTFLRVL